ncbi:MAG: hypothetical protein AAGB31_15105, partial [Bdellovibrio sp.]
MLGSRTKAAFILLREFVDGITAEGVYDIKQSFGELASPWSKVGNINHSTDSLHGHHGGNNSTQSADVFAFGSEET